MFIFEGTHILELLFIVSVMLIGSVVIDNQSILTLLEAWLTVARDLLYYTEQFTINARYQSAVNLSR